MPKCIKQRETLIDISRIVEYLKCIEQLDTLKVITCKDTTLNGGDWTTTHGSVSVASVASGLKADVPTRRFALPGVE